MQPAGAEDAELWRERLVQIFMAFHFSVVNAF